MASSILADSVVCSNYPFIPFNIPACLQCNLLSSFAFMLASQGTVARVDSWASVLWQKEQAFNDPAVDEPPCRLLTNMVGAA
jgi:hypothetical protein